MTTYTVTYRAHDTAREIGRFDSLEDAVATACEAGAIYDDNRIERFDANSAVREVGLNVRGHLFDDEYVWIERSR